ncbi:DUF2484 family protein [Wenxinia saemankumensis]|uniref:UDP-N-acetylmuramate--alanine ligase n=1 Tax=Wenxinia saemankumensis TaxID=1447782 RepID=A0A1M6CHH6_9RHOB|nr:DUF2484 family protein [Wenxinia saemankumensis]SHI60485.1 Protein of unknown function [Wenxinia saemankumensis]
MSPALTAACLWALLGTVTALLPMRRQMVPGLVLLVSAPFLLAWLAVAHGWWVLALGLAAFASMMRNPIRYLLARARGQRPEIPR